MYLCQPTQPSSPHPPRRDAAQLISQSPSQLALAVTLLTTWLTTLRKQKQESKHPSLPDSWRSHWLHPSLCSAPASWQPPHRQAGGASFTPAQKSHLPCADAEHGPGPSMQAGAAASAHTEPFPCGRCQRHHIEAENQTWVTGIATDCPPVLESRLFCWGTGAGREDMVASRDLQSLDCSDSKTPAVCVRPGQEESLWLLSSVLCEALGRLFLS